MAQIRQLVALVCTVLLTVAVMVGAVSAAPRTAPGPPGKIVISSRGFGSGADLVNPDGSGRTPVQVPGGYRPVWSADGKWLAYSNFPEPWVIRVARADGSGDREVLSKDASAPATEPSYTWSPTGAEIAYPCATGLCAVRVSDGATRRVIDVPSPSRVSYPAWSPDGSWIAFGCSFIGALCMVRPDGSEPTVFTSDSGPRIGFPDWAPDGTRMVFSNGARVYTLDLDDGEVRQIFDLGGSGSAQARWSPDGRRLVIYLSPSVYVAELGGGQPTKIAEGGRADWGTSPAATLTDARFEPKWVLSRQAGRLVVSGAASHPSELTVTIRSPRKSYPARTTAVPAGAYSASVSLPPDLAPGAYQVSVGGASAGEKLLETTRVATLAAPASGLISSSSLVASRNSKRLTARFVFSARPAGGKRPTAVWLSPTGAVVRRDRLPNAPTVTSSLVGREPFARGRWRCRLEVGGVVLAIPSTRIG